jgi:hypothetical protein
MRSRSLRSLALGSALAFAAALALGACQKDTTNLGAPSTCAADEPCHGTVKGGGSGAGGGGGEGGGGEAVDASGTVSVLVSAAFDQTSTFSGQATVVAPGASGSDVTADFAPGTGFTIHGVASGATWFLVKDPTAGGSGIFSTFSLQHAPSTSLVLPVMDRTVLAGIASALPTATTLDPGRAHLVVFVDRGGQPLAGATLAGGAFGGTLAYDEGAGFYSSSATATGAAGIVLILNASAPGQGTATIHVADPDGNPYALDVPIAPDTVTLVGMAI